MVDCKICKHPYCEHAGTQRGIVVNCDNYMPQQMPPANEPLICSNIGCPIWKCDKHPRLMGKMAKDGVTHVRLADLAGTCRDYIAFLTEVYGK